VTTTSAELDGLSPDVLDHLFTEARTAYSWADGPVSDDVVAAAVRAAVHGPTAFNTQPMRVLAIRDPAVRARLVSHLMGSNQEKTTGAPLTLVLTADTAFADTAETVFPQAAQLIRSLFEDRAAAEPAARLNAAMQAGYLIVALRAAGLAVGPMSGGDFAGIDADLFEGTAQKSFLVLNLGYPTAESFRPRNPRVDSDLVLRTV